MSYRAAVISEQCGGYMTSSSRNEKLVGLNTRSRLGLAILLCSSAPLAVAAEGADEAGTAQLQEVVITAEKKTEDVQHAPIAIQTASQAQLEAVGVRSEQDLQNVVPAVRFGEAPSLVITIRGIGTQSTTGGNDLAAAASLDGVYLAKSAAMPSIMFDLNRVEIALGPQGTLVGRNSNAGVINIITNDPKPQFEGSGTVQFGNYDALSTEGMINIPLGDKAALRVSGATNSHSNYHEDGSNDAHATAGRAKLLLTPIDDLRIIFSVDGSTFHNRSFEYAYCPPHSNVPACAGVPWQPFTSNMGTNPDSHARIHTFGMSGQVDWDMPWASLTSITALRTYRDDNADLHRNFEFNNPGEGFGLADYTKDTFFTQELRLASRRSAPFTWVVGTFFSNEIQPDNLNYLFKFLTPPTSFDYDMSHGHYTSEAVFGDVAVPITDRLRLRGGLRYTWEDKEQTGTAYVYPGAPPAGPALSATGIGGEEKLSRLTWKAGADFDITDHNLLYATGSNGFKSGGVNRVPDGSGLPLTYAPEFITAEEIGSKNRFFGDRLQVNLSAFHYRYEGYQSTTALNSPTGGFYFATLSSQTATLYGGELEVKMLITPHDLFSVNLTEESSRFDQFILPAAGIDWSGNHAPVAPNYTAGASYMHTFTLPGNNLLHAGVDTLLSGPFFVDPSNEPGSYQNAYTRTNASLSFDSPDTGWTVTAYIRNIENYGALNIWYSPIPGEPQKDIVGVDPPRTFGISIKKSFQ
jgi:iron complex outermembrane recepter protein